VDSLALSPWKRGNRLPTFTVFGRARTPTVIKPEQAVTTRICNPLQHPPMTESRRSRRPRSDKHRSRNHVIARAPKRNRPHGQKDLGAKSDTLHL